MSKRIRGVAEKHAGIDRDGTSALYKAGGIQKFGGFPDTLNNRYNASLIFTPNASRLDVWGKSFGTTCGNWRKT